MYFVIRSNFRHNQSFKFLSTICPQYLMLDSYTPRIWTPTTGGRAHKHFYMSVEKWDFKKWLIELKMFHFLLNNMQIRIV